MLTLCTNEFMSCERTEAGSPSFGSPVLDASQAIEYGMIHNRDPDSRWQLTQAFLSLKGLT